MTNLEQAIQQKIDLKTKPLGALGQLEELAKQICMVQKTLEPVLKHPTIIVFAADHGIAQCGVSAYPPAVTAQMVLNFLNGGAAINVFCKQHHIQLKIADAGVNYNFDAHPDLIDAKIANGTSNYLAQKAMTALELEACFTKAKVIVNEIAATGCNIIGFGEMGIGNTSSAALIMSALCQLPLASCVGKGTGLDNTQYLHKMKILQQALDNHPSTIDARTALMQYGGFEIAQMCAAMLQSFENNMLIMVDGFIASTAFLCAYKIQPEILNHAIFCHQSNEQGHKYILNYLNVKAILQLDMRLGEGTGCALAYPLLQSAVQFMNEMASFESAGVSNK